MTPGVITIRIVVTLAVLWPLFVHKPPPAFVDKVAAQDWRSGQSTTSVVDLPPILWPPLSGHKKTAHGDIAVSASPHGNMRSADGRLCLPLVALWATRPQTAGVSRLLAGEATAAPCAALARRRLPATWGGRI